MSTHCRLFYYIAASTSPSTHALLSQYPAKHDLVHYVSWVSNPDSSVCVCVCSLCVA